MCRKFKVNVARTVFKRRRHLACARDHYSETHERALPKIRFIIRNAVVLTTTPTTPNPATSYIRQCVLYMQGGSICFFRNTYFRIFIEKLFSKYVVFEYFTWPTERSYPASFKLFFSVITFLTYRVHPF